MEANDWAQEETVFNATAKNGLTQSSFFYGDLGRSLRPFWPVTQRGPYRAGRQQGSDSCSWFICMAKESHVARCFLHLSPNPKFAPLSCLLPPWSSPDLASLDRFFSKVFVGFDLLVSKKKQESPQKKKKGKHHVVFCSCSVSPNISNII